MTEQTRPQLSDALIERMLAERAGHGAPADLVDAIATAVESTGQRPSRLLAVVSAPTTWRSRWAGGSFSKRTMVFAAFAVAVVVVAAGAGLFLRFAPAMIGGPSNAPAIAPEPSTSVAPSLSPAPSETQSAVQPGSRVFVFNQLDQSGETQTLWVANLDGTGAHALVPDLGGCQGMPAWSPDGTRLLFSRRECAPWTSLGDAGTRLYLTDASGSEPQLVDTGCVAPCVSDSDGAFSSDGRRILFVRLKSIPAALSSPTPNPLGKVPPFTDVRVLASMDLATGRVTEGGSWKESGYPSWSPDGTQIVFGREIHPFTPVADHFTSYDAIFLADGDGRNVHQVGPAGGMMPGWSPDGTRIVFQVERYSWVGNVIRTFIDIYTIRPDGTDLRRLTTDQISTNPEWGADGRIWFIRTPMVGGDGRTAGARQLWTMDADGSHAARPSLPPLLQELLLNYSPPVWQPTP